MFGKFSGGLLLALLPLGVSGYGQIKTYGIDFSPYETGQSSGFNTSVSAGQIVSRMQRIAPYTNWVRSFGSTKGLENTPAIARQFGLKVAAGAWIGPDRVSNAAEIANLIAAAQAGNVDVAIVGSGAIHRNDVTVVQLVDYMNQVRLAIPSGIPVVTAEVWRTFIDNPGLIAASDQIWAGFDPYVEGMPVDGALCSLEREYRQLVNVAASKTVVLEVAWPDAGNPAGAAVRSTENSRFFALRFLSWSKASNIPSFYSDVADEPWKTLSEVPQGAYRGGFDVNAFGGQTAAPVCSVPASPGISFTYVPPFGSADNLEARVTGVQPGNYAIATYIYIEALGTWWSKPTQAQPTVPIDADGAARIAIDTGGVDAQATKIAAFLVPAGIAPAIVVGGALPDVPGAAAEVQVSRTRNSLSGRIVDNRGNPLAGAIVSDPVLGLTTSGPDGKYSFYNLPAVPTATLRASASNHVFSSPAPVTIPSGNLQVNFTGIPRANGSQAALAASLAAPGPAVTWTNNTLAHPKLAQTQGSSPTGSTANGVPGSGSSGSGSSQTFTFTFTDSASWTNIQHVDVLINSALDGRQACYLAFVPSGPSAGSLFLVDDAGDSGGPYVGTTLPGQGSVQNSQCSVAGTGATITGSGTTLTLSLPIVFNANFAGNKVFYLSSQNFSGVTSSWQALLTWNVPGPSFVGPGVSGMSPFQSAALSQTYTFTFTDTNGWQDIGVADVLLNSALDGSSACYVAIVPSSATSGFVYLVDDAGDAAGPYLTMKVPGAALVQNGQCGIKGSSSSISASGNTLTVKLAMVFNQSFGGNQVFYLSTGSAGGQNSGWQSVGTAQIP